MPHRRWFTAALSEADTGRRRIHRGLPPGAVLAHKTGTGGHPSEVPGYWKKLAQANANSGNTDSKPIAKNQKRPSPKRAGSSSASGDGDSDDSEPTSSEVISAVNDIGIITLPDGRHIILAVYINDSVSVNPDRSSPTLQKRFAIAGRQDRSLICVNIRVTRTHVPFGRDKTVSNIHRSSAVLMLLSCGNENRFNFCRRSFGGLFV